MRKNQNKELGKVTGALLTSRRRCHLDQCFAEAQVPTTKVPFPIEKGIQNKGDLKIQTKEG